MWTSLGKNPVTKSYHFFPSSWKLVEIFYLYAAQKDNWTTQSIEAKCELYNKKNFQKKIQQENDTSSDSDGSEEEDEEDETKEAEETKEDIHNEEDKEN